MQEAVTTLLHDLLDEGVSVYIDDVSIVAKDLETHDHLLTEVFNRLSKHHFQVKIKKCFFYAKQVEFLGFIITPDHVKPNPNKVEAILKLAEPGTRKKLQKFLGMCNYYRRFIRNYSNLTRPLNQQTSIKQPYKFTPECKNAFNQLKDILANDVTLKIVDYDERFYISCDASDTAISAVLAQGKPPHDRPIQFFSKALTHPQEKWIIMERECLALVSAVKAFSNYLHGREFTLITDNLALVYIYKHNDPYSKLFRMKMELMSYKYTIIYRKGAYNKVADALTRLDYEREMDITEFLTKYSEDMVFKNIRAITRSKAKVHDKPNDGNTLVPFITSKPGFANEDSEYDCIFSLINSTNRKLIGELSNDKIDQTLGLVQLSDNHFLATINPAGTTNEELKRITQAIINECDERELITIAINTDLHPKYRFILKYLIENNQNNTNLHVTIHSNKTTKLSDTRHIKSALEMHHKTHGGAHLNIQQMIDHMKYLYQWKNMVEDIKNHILECNTCSKSAIQNTKTNKNHTPIKHTETPTIKQSTLEYKLDLADENDYESTFSIISATNDHLISKLTNSNDFKPITTVTSINPKNHIALIQSGFEDEIKNILDTIFNFCEENKFGKIAINTDLRDKQMFTLKWLLHKNLLKTKIYVTLHINQIIELSDPQQIQTALETHHTSLFGGHCGIQRMTNTMQRLYKWPNMTSDIKNFVGSCTTCAKTKTTRHTRAPLQITSTGERPFEHIFIDYMGPITPSEQGHKYIFVATCDLTKYSIAVPTMDHSAATTADVFMKEIILRFGFPSVVTSDNGGEFLNELFTELNKKLEIKKNFTTPYHPSSNIVERQNKNTNQYLRAYIDKKPQTWASLLPYASFAYNTTIHSTTGYTPFQLVYGREITLPEVIKKKKPIYNYDNFVDLMLRELHDAWSLSREKLQIAKTKNKKYYDKKVHSPLLQVGDYVLVKNESKDHKFDNVSNGPYKIIEIPSEQYVIVKIANENKKIHRNRIKKTTASFPEISQLEQQIIKVITTFT